jgi:hypothetical protein
MAAYIYFTIGFFGILTVASAAVLVSHDDQGVRVAAFLMALFFAIVTYAGFSALPA